MNFSFSINQTFKEGPDLEDADEEDVVGSLLQLEMRKLNNELEWAKNLNEMRVKLEYFQHTLQLVALRLARPR